MTSKLLSRRDVEFLLYEWLDVTALCARPRHADHSRETFDAALDTAERIATEVFLPYRRKSDLEEPQFDGERVRLIVADLSTPQPEQPGVPSSAGEPSPTPGSN